MVQWLGLHASDAGSAGSIPGQKTEIPHAVVQDQEVKTRQQNLTTLIWKAVNPCSIQCCFRLNDAKWLYVCKSINKHHFCVYMFFILQNAFTLVISF